MLSNGEIEVGMNVTITEWEPRTINTVLGGQRIVKDRSYIGEEMKVIAVALPFVKVLKKDKYNGGKVTEETLNLNELKLMELPDSFINPNPERCCFCGYKN